MAFRLDMGSSHNLSNDIYPLSISYAYNKDRPGLPTMQVTLNNTSSARNIMIDETVTLYVRGTNESTWGSSMFYGWIPERTIQPDIIEYRCKPMMEKLKEKDIKNVWFANAIVQDKMHVVTVTNTRMTADLDDDADPQFPLISCHMYVPGHAQLEHTPQQSTETNLYNHGASYIILDQAFSAERGLFRGCWMRMKRDANMSTSLRATLKSANNSGWPGTTVAVMDTPASNISTGYSEYYFDFLNNVSNPSSLFLNYGTNAHPTYWIALSLTGNQSGYNYTFYGWSKKGSACGPLIHRTALNTSSCDPKNLWLYADLPSKWKPLDYNDGYIGDMENRRIIIEKRDVVAGDTPGIGEWGLAFADWGAPWNGGEMIRATYLKGNFTTTSSIYEFMTEQCGDMYDTLTLNVTNASYPCKGFFVENSNAYDVLMNIGERRPLFFDLQLNQSDEREMTFSDQLNTDDWTTQTSSYQCYRTFRANHNQSSPGGIVIGQPTMTETKIQSCDGVVITGPQGDVMGCAGMTGTAQGNKILQTGFVMDLATGNKIADEVYHYLHSAQKTGSFPVIPSDASHSIDALRTPNQLIFLNASNIIMNEACLIQSLKWDINLNEGYKVDLNYHTLKDYYIVKRINILEPEDNLGNYTPRKRTITLLKNATAPSPTYTSPTPGCNVGNTPTGNNPTQGILGRSTQIARHNTSLQVGGAAFYFFQLGTGAPSGTTLGAPASTNIPASITSLNRSTQNVISATMNYTSFSSNQSGYVSISEVALKCAEDITGTNMSTVAAWSILANYSSGQWYGRPKLLRGEKLYISLTTNSG